MITLTKLRELPISAASGLVIMQNKLHVIADDALHLHIYALQDATHQQHIRLCEGELPEKKKARKKLKPDFEALVQLPPAATHPHGALLALGSGSKTNRQRGVLVPLDAQGCATTAITTLDLAPLYAACMLEDCNIEGAVVCGQQLVLLQRGNQRHEQSALVLCALDVFPAPASPRVIPVTLPMIDGCPLGFTDGVCLPNGNILFAAVAEVTDDSYNDGACLGAAIGEITVQGELLYCTRLAEPHKIEGIAVAGDNFYLVTDADDAAIPAALLTCRGALHAP